MAAVPTPPSESYANGVLWPAFLEAHRVRDLGGAVWLT